MNQVLLGAETDDVLFERLRAEVLALGGSIQNAEWTIGGSQEVTTYTILLPEGRLEAIAETYVGLSLRGPASMVSLLAKRVSGK